MSHRARVLAVIFTALAAPAWSSTWVNGVANASVGPGAPVSDSQFDETAVSVAANATFTDGYTLSASSHGSGSVAYGIAEVGVAGGVVGGRSDASIAAFFDDRFTIPGGDQYTGQTGLLTINIAFTYTSDARTSFGNADFDVQQKLRVDSAAGSLQVEQRALTYDPRSAASDFSYRTVVLATPNGYTQEDLPFATTYAVSVPFMFDQQVYVSNQFSIQGAAGAGTQNDSASFELDALHSFYWAGMTVQDSTGAPVTATLVSDSGTDWRQSFVPSPVPEPATVAMWAAGLCLIGWRARRSPHTA